MSDLLEEFPVFLFCNDECKKKAIKGIKTQYRAPFNYQQIHIETGFFKSGGPEFKSTMSVSWFGWAGAMCDYFTLKNNLKDRFVFILMGPGKDPKKYYFQITDFKAEKIQDISEDDLRAEGFETKEEFRKAWDSFKKAEAFLWDANPFCWVYIFQRITRRKAEQEMRELQARHKKEKEAE